MGGDWQNGLFSCFDNPIMCLFICCVPCGWICTQVVEIRLIKGKDDTKSQAIHCLLDCCCGVYGAAYTRTVVRNEYGINGNYVVDCLLLYFCGICGLTQEWMEVADKKLGDKKKALWDAK